MRCPSDETFALFFDGELSTAEENAVREHVDGCERCRVLLADAAAAAPFSPTKLDPVIAETLDDVPAASLFARRFRISGVIGKGGMGFVLRALHVDLNRTVAIKMMHAELAGDADAARRFLGEARAAAALKSPHALRILDVDRVEGTGLPFIVMEYLEGKNLATILAEEGPVDERRAIDWLLASLDAVGEAHTLGIVHRDLKPENLFLGRDGIVKVLDFGLAKGAVLETPRNASEGTESKVMLGSPFYISPEQIRSSRQVDARSDIWALGATLHFLLTGVPPFTAPNLYILCSRILNEEALSLRRLRPALSPAIDALVLTCLRKPPSLRFPDCESLAAALRAARSNGSVSPPTKQGPPPRAPAPGATSTLPLPTLKRAPPPAVDTDPTEPHRPAVLDETEPHAGRK